jgi:threonine dehydrogenase-like Zn-dependent dehydrogenase
MSCGLKSGQCRYLADGSYNCSDASGIAGYPPSGVVEGFASEMVDKVKQMACNLMPGTSMCSDQTLNFVREKVDRS